MSIDTYFCFCCLSTNDLFSLYSNDTNTNYANLLQSLFNNISISLEDYEYDGHICNDCAHSLTGIQKFKAQVFETLNILQNTCLIELSNENELVKVKKTQEILSEIEEKHAIEQASKYIVLFENTIEEKSKKVRNEQEILDKLMTPSEIQIEEEILEKITQTKPLEGEHSQKKRDRQIAKQVTQYEVPDDLKCKECGMVLPNIYMYHTHMNEHYPNHICEACGKGVRPFGVSLLICGWEGDRPYLFQCDPSGAYFAWKATAMGKNFNNGKTFLEKRYTEELELDDAVHTAILTLKEGFEGQMNADNIEVGICDAASFRRLDPAHVKDYLANIP